MFSQVLESLDFLATLFVEVAIECFRIFQPILRHAKQLCLKDCREFLSCFHHGGGLKQVRAALRDFDANLEIVSTEEQREEAINLATEQEEWLYDDGWDMDAATYRKKRAELAEVGGWDDVGFHLSVCRGIERCLILDSFHDQLVT